MVSAMPHRTARPPDIRLDNPDLRLLLSTRLNSFLPQEAVAAQFEVYEGKSLRRAG